MTEPKYFPTNQEIEEVLTLREQYWGRALDPETTITWTRKLRSIESRPGFLKRALEAICQRGHRFPPFLPTLCLFHRDLRVEAFRLDAGRAKPPKSVEKESPHFRAAYDASALGHWPNEHERWVVLGAFNDEFGWPKRYAYIARVRQRGAEARAMLEKAGLMETVLERYRELCEGRKEVEGCRNELP